MHTYTFTDTHTYLQKRSFFDLLTWIHQQHHFFSSVDFLWRGNAHDKARQVVVNSHTSVFTRVCSYNGIQGGNTNDPHHTNVSLHHARSTCVQLQLCVRTVVTHNTEERQTDSALNAAIEVVQAAGGTVKSHYNKTISNVILFSLCRTYKPHLFMLLSVKKSSRYTFLCLAICYVITYYTQTSI